MERKEEKESEVEDRREVGLPHSLQLALPQQTQAKELAQ
jgi:hypothetical protein